MKMTNAEWMLKRGYKFSDLCVCREPLNYKNSIKDGGDWAFHIRLLKANYDEISSEKSLLDALIAWLDAEHKELILDDAEKRYLKGVIRPFRYRIIWIKKAYRSGNYEQIIIRMKSIVPDAILVDIQFPFFKGNGMYKGMNLGKEYTLEELGL